MSRRAEQSPSCSPSCTPSGGGDIPLDRFTPNPRGIPRAFVITLARTPERTAEAIRQLMPLGLRIELVRATDGQGAEAAELPRDPGSVDHMQPGECALCMSYWRVCCRIVRDNLPWALIFEDDVKVISADGLLEALEQLPGDFHFAHLNDAAKPAPVPMADRTAPAPWMAVMHPSYVTVAYCLSNAGARAVLSGMAPFRVPLDKWLVENKGGYNIYQVAPEKAWFRQSWWRPSTVRENNVPMPVPRQFHRIWVGDAVRPAVYDEYWNGWKRLHPGYAFRTWGEADVAREWPDHPAIAKAETAAAKSDIIRLLVLERFGGVYVDTDYEAFHSFDELLGAGALIVPDMHEGVPCNGWLAAAPGNPWVRRMLAEATERTLAGMPILEAAGPALIKDIIAPAREAWPKALTDPEGRCIATAYGDTGVVVIKPDVMFSYYWTEARPESHGTAWAAHHWAASWWGMTEWEAHWLAYPHLKPVTAADWELFWNIRPHLKTSNA